MDLVELRDQVQAGFKLLITAMTLLCIDFARLAQGQRIVDSIVCSA